MKPSPPFSHALQFKRTTEPGPHDSRIVPGVSSRPTGRTEPKGVKVPYLPFPIQPPIKPLSLAFFNHSYVEGEQEVIFGMITTSEQEPTIEQTP
jgi:hypothetical protein